MATKRILLIKRSTSFLPEVDAYTEYFKQDPRFQFETVMESDFQSSHVRPGDVLWQFAGRVFPTPAGVAAIHEYNSLSITLSFIKDRLKPLLNPRPELRIFLNDFVRSKLHFYDRVPHVIRDMGIHPRFFQQKNTEKTHDFVYVGTLYKIRKVNDLFRKVVDSQWGSLLVIGGPTSEIDPDLLKHPACTFTGPVPYERIPELASRARMALNLIPDEYPFNRQTSTKMIEYCALGIPVITTETQWIRGFEQSRNTQFCRWDNYSPGKTLSPPPDVRDLEWSRILDATGLKEKILSLQAPNRVR